MLEELVAADHDHFENSLMFAKPDAQSSAVLGSTAPTALALHMLWPVSNMSPQGIPRAVPAPPWFDPLPRPPPSARPAPRPRPLPRPANEGRFSASRQIYQQLHAFSQGQGLRQLCNAASQEQKLCCEQERLQGVPACRWSLHIEVQRRLG